MIRKESAVFSIGESKCVHCVAVASYVHPSPRTFQNAFHQNLLQMKDSARASIFAMPAGASARSTLYSRDGHSDESHTPILQAAAPKGSSLRYTMDDDNSINDEGVMLRGGHSVM